LGEGPFTPQVAASTFSQGFQGISWLGPNLVTPAIIAAFCWMWGGFALVVIGAGLSALPRDVLEAARVDGANEWQTFRYVTLPLLAPVLGVVFVTMVINVIKIFDIVLMAPGASQDEANVIALEMYRSAFTSRQYGLGSVIAVLIFLLVVPIMVLNIRRFRREAD
jgi:alpha-glucoside transport system permease protein